MYAPQLETIRSSAYTACATTALFPICFFNVAITASTPFSPITALISSVQGVVRSNHQVMINSWQEDVLSKAIFPRNKQTVSCREGMSPNAFMTFNARPSKLNDAAEPFTIRFLFSSEEKRNKVDLFHKHVDRKGTIHSTQIAQSEEGHL